ncbi:hypothetical protein ACFOU2_11360 [Bacillus songklensis]|uniref:Uncharacterized protein n=1 Tax=Bacillus songklensis TaxID=1069116 RepID=A0ABV8B178_9BACI
MDVIDELYHNVVFQLSSKELTKIMQCIKNKKEQEIEEIKDKISKYEQKKRAEEAWYQSLSPIRKIFAGRPPSHHQAVEYMVYVKDRFKKIEQIKQRMVELDKVINLLQNDLTIKEIALPTAIIEEMKLFRETEVR